MSTNKEHKKPETENINKVFDELLEKTDLSYTDLNFDKYSGDVLEAYKKLNKQIHQKPGYFRSFKKIVSSFNYQLILKPLYTMVLTAIVIFTIIKLQGTNDVEYAEVSVDQGEKIQLYVTNEVKIWVNSGSNIRIPLTIKKNPKIYLSGEAYFEINKEKGKAIQVYSKGIEIKASKANFNIKSDKHSLITTISEGKVQFYNPRLPKSTSLELVAKDQALYQSKLEFIAVEKENSMNYLSWHTGRLKFDQTPLYEAVNTISEIYEIPILITNREISKNDFNAEFNHADIDEILDTIQSTFNCEISADGSKIIIN